MYGVGLSATVIVTAAIVSMRRYCQCRRTLKVLWASEACGPGMQPRNMAAAHNTGTTRGDGVGVRCFEGLVSNLI